MATSNLASSNDIVRIAVLGCGMMGQEHISYINKYPNLAIRFLCDPNESSMDTALAMMENETPTALQEEKQLLEHIDEIDLLVIASVRYYYAVVVIVIYIMTWYIIKIATLAAKLHAHTTASALGTMRHYYSGREAGGSQCKASCRPQGC